MVRLPCLGRAGYLSRRNKVLNHTSHCSICSSGCRYWHTPAYLARQASSIEVTCARLPVLLLHVFVSSEPSFSSKLAEKARGVWCPTFLAQIEYCYLLMHMMGWRGWKARVLNNHLKIIVLTVEMSQIYTRLLCYFGLLCLLSEEHKIF